MVAIMERQDFIRKADEILRLVRLERGFTQDRMSEILGISKKTLIQIEKGRASLGWSGAVVLGLVFNASPVVEMAFGGSLPDLIQALAFGGYEVAKEKTLGGHVWWKTLQEGRGLRIQQNIISGHFRILDSEARRICSSFDETFIRQRFRELQDFGREK